MTIAEAPKVRKRGAPSIFTIEEDEFIIEHYPKGTCSIWMSEQIGKTVKQIKNRALRLGVSRPALPVCTPQLMERLKELWEEGVDRRQIAHELGISHHQVGKWAWNHGLRRPEGFMESAIRNAREASIRAALKDKANGLRITNLPERKIDALYAGQRYEDMRLKS